MKDFDIEFRSITYLTYRVKASSKKEAIEKAKEKLQDDQEVSTEWKESSEAISLMQG